MKEILVKGLYHRKQEQIGFYFEEDYLLQRVIRTVPLIKFSHTHSCWYIPLDKNNLKNARTILSGHAKVNIEEFRSYLEKRKQVISADILVKNVKQIDSGLTKTGLSKFVISYQNLEVLKEMLKVLHLKAYSQNTIALYTGEMTVLLRLLGEVHINTVISFRYNHN